MEKVKKILKKEPGLKARDIAQRVSYSTKEVNQILHFNPSLFIQDKSSFTWALISSEKKVEVTFENRWVNCDSFEESLLCAKDEIENGNAVIFILPKKCSFLLDALARFLALCNQLAINKVDVSIDFSNSSQLKHYLNRVGFFDHLNSKVEILPRRPKRSTAKSHKGLSENLEEIGEVTPHEDEDAKDQLVTRLTEKFINLTNNDYKSAISTIFAELAGNIQEHSNTPLNGFAGLQKYKGSKPHIQTVVSDSGDGIAKTLRPSLKRHHNELYKLYNKVCIANDIALVTKVMENGLISRYGAGRGLGFKTSRESALKFEAKYSVRQENFSLEFIFRDGVLQRVISKKGLVKILGTHICFDFNID